jgi:hypothetical protein
MKTFHHFPVNHGYSNLSRFSELLFLPILAGGSPHGVLSQPCFFCLPVPPSGPLHTSPHPHSAGPSQHSGDTFRLHSLDLLGPCAVGWFPMHLVPKSYSCSSCCPLQDLSVSCLHNSLESSGRSGGGKTFFFFFPELSFNQQSTTVH